MLLLILMLIIIQIIIVNMDNMVLHIVAIMVHKKVGARDVASRLMEVMEDTVTMEIVEGTLSVKDAKEAIRVTMLVITINTEVKKTADVDVEVQVIVVNTDIHILILTE